jgi:hypothetical protein
MWPGPLPGDELPVPPEERLGPDQERPPLFPPKHPARGGEERPVGRTVDRPRDLSTEDGDLVAEHRDLEVRLSRCVVV